MSGAARESGGDADAAEAVLTLRVLSALLREDAVGLRTRTTALDRPDGRWLRLADPAGPAGPAGPGALLVPVAPDGFQSAYGARLPLLLRESGDGATEVTGLDAVLAALAAHADPEDRDGFRAFAAECRQSLAVARLHAATWEETAAAVTARYGPDPARWTGHAGTLAHDTLAARLDHPVYPASRARAGLTDADLRACAPEFHPRFALRWLAVPRDALTLRGALDPAAGQDPPDAWPAPSVLGLPSALDRTHLALPVHPLTAGGPLAGALRAAGLAGRAALAPLPYLDVVPTLSMRTVAAAADPRLHLKLPLATATLGLRNRRTVKPATLADGATVQRLLEAVARREPRFRDTVLHADETAYAHAGHELLAALCRRQPAGLDGALVVPLAALLAPAPGGRLVVEHLADRCHGGDVPALLDDLLTLLFDYQTTLFGYGIALESHQQNVSLVLDPPERTAEGRPRTRLLFKDDDGPRIHHARLRAALGPGAPGPGEFADARTLCEGDGPVADVFATITVHLCAGAYAFGLARHGVAPLAALLALVRDRLAEAVDRLGTGPGEPGTVLRAHVLRAGHLPVKAMVTAGSLQSKERSGATDVNKHYTTGPNYLRAVPRAAPAGPAPYPSIPSPRPGWNR
ncbi:IucA/IucC family siderophore biosynthesis protein [Streptomyces sp. WMMC500]|uniref:IucA/IucC family protein n=1 Tax=Streptomyces sp. WMMC500 TaxID=3015154 RepID=UPI00248B4462|nr:IucA/IucC family siderophore biosynthesis protein [Streptomyces sp. WMMC500]WBB61186.1 IucA/IucC family siderophore biosynthesis protein [Streptomyces sp. WMMC500]